MSGDQLWARGLPGTLRARLPGHRRFMASHWNFAIKYTLTHTPGTGLQAVFGVNGKMASLVAQINNLSAIQETWV